MASYCINAPLARFLRAKPTTPSFRQTSHNQYKRWRINIKAGIGNINSTVHGDGTHSRSNWLSDV
ncbi:MAG: hypothetical protein U5M23_12015 [Marinagarivorans sp.]|nr:hypothetical protein [Marinagarivorans sp.]